MSLEEKSHQVINPEIFRAYDVRGIYPSQLNKEVAYRIGRALVLFLKIRFKDLSDIRPLIVVGRDCRLSSPEIHRVFIQGLMKQGANVIDIGLIPTDAVYFALNFLKADAAAMITASHNPPEYNGIKMVVRGSKYVCGEWGMTTIKKLVFKNKFCNNQKQGKISKKNIAPAYIKHILKISRRLGVLSKSNSYLNTIKAAVDVGHGVAGIIIGRLAKQLSLDLVFINNKPNGYFPRRSPNPLIAKNIKFLKQEIIKRKLDFGLAFDGDGDRAVFVDEKGEAVSGDLIIVLFAKYFLNEFPGSKIVYNLTCSRAVQEIIREQGGYPKRAKTGHAFMKRVAKKSQAIFGGEISGHLYFQDNSYAECGGLTLLLMLKILSESKEPLSFLIKKIKRYYRVGEINLVIKDRTMAIKKLAKKYQNGRADRLDGLTVQFEDWWFNARSSNTEPFLRIVVEADSMALVQKRKKEILDLLT